MGDIQAWWDSLPPVTRTLFAGSMGVTLAAGFGILPPYWLTFDVTRLYSNFEIWRLLTPFLYHGRLGFPFLMNMLWLVQYGQIVEREAFGGETADYIFFLLFGAILLYIPGVFLPMAIMSKSLLIMLIYFWSRKFPDNIVTFYFGIRFKSIYLPWVLVGFNLLLGGMPLHELIGIIVGHIYYFLTVVYPQQSGRQILRTPDFLKYYFPGPNAAAQRPGAGPRQAGYNWGQGQRLQ